MTKPSSLDKLADSIFGRLALTLLSGTVATLAVPFLFFTNSILPPVILRWTALAWLGLAVGLAARGLLQRYPFLMRLSAALGSLLVCISLVSPLTSGYVGLHFLLNAGLAPDWQGLPEIFFSATVAYLALFAQRKPRVRVAPHNQAPAAEKISLTDKRPPKKSKQSKIASQENPGSRTASPSPALPRSKPWHFNVKTLSKRMGVWRRQMEQAALDSRRKAGAYWKRSQQALRLRLRPSSRQVSFPSARLRVPAKSSVPSSVRLVGVEEHRCPYCLELVEPNDARGIKICPVCATHHHADCWAVTGACQVPHHHE